MSRPSEYSRSAGSDRQLVRRSAALVAAVFLGVVSPTPARAQGPNTDGGKAYLFPENFKAFKFMTASGVEINGVIGGKGPAVLLGQMGAIQDSLPLPGQVR
jgi:hypothetical protein